MAVLQATDCESLAGVPASTHKPQIVRHTMLHQRWGRNLPWLTVGISRKDIDLTYHITVRLKPTGRTGVEASPGFVPMAALWTGLAGIVFILKHQTYPSHLRGQSSLQFRE